MDQDETWRGDRPRLPPHCVLWGPSFPKRAHCSPFTIFGPYLLWPTDGWIKKPLGTEVGLGPGDIVLDGDRAPPQKGAQQPPLFGLRILWPNGRMDEDATWYGGRPRPRPHYVRWGPISSQEGLRSPQFSAMSLAAKRLYTTNHIIFIAIFPTFQTLYSTVILHHSHHQITMP